MTQGRSPDVREKLKAIRDSDHPAAPWARNVVQIMDAMPHKPNDPVALRYLGKNVAMLQRVAIGALNEEATVLTPDEIAAIFGLGDPQ